MNSGNRVVLVDFLRGFALMGIVLIHSVEHFDFFGKPETNFLFSAETDQSLINLMFMLISGKAYSIFALMFGFSFFIQMNRQENKGVDFRWRFLWRLTILLTIGFLHSLLYQGDILHIYALLGFVLVALYRVNTKLLIAFSILLALQIPLLYNLIVSLTNPGYAYITKFGGNYWQEGENAFANGSFIDVVQFNLWKGRWDVWGWTVNNGRYLQLVALFIAGLVIGRKRYFEKITEYKRNTLKLLGIVSMAIVALLFAKNYILSTNLNNSQRTLFETIFNSYINLGFTAFIILILIQIYLIFHKVSLIGYLANYGRMSLTNYLTQAIIGVVFFYGYGLGMYRYMGTAWSIIYGLAFLALQIAFCKFWLAKHKYGPFEWFWRACTFFDFTIKNKREI
jgi:uncharacterized protein